MCCAVSREQSTAVADCIIVQSIERQNAEIKGEIFGWNNSEIILSWCIIIIYDLKREYSSDCIMMNALSLVVVMAGRANLQ